MTKNEGVTPLCRGQSLPVSMANHSLKKKQLRELGFFRTETELRAVDEARQRHQSSLGLRFESVFTSNQASKKKSSWVRNGQR